MKQAVAKVVSFMLCLCMLFSFVPFSALAAVDYDKTVNEYYNVIRKDDYELAPGISESEIVLNNDAGTHRQVAHVVEVDLSNPYTKVIPSYKGMIPQAGSYGIQVMSEQAAWAEANGYGNVVAAMNLSLSWYDSAYYAQHPELVGEPLGYMVLDGNIYMNSQGQTGGAQTCVVINFDEKDGVARPADMPKVEIRSTSSAITGWEEQVIPANFGFLVKDGVNQYGVDNNPANGASRSFVGIKADGTFVMVMNDGRQAPYSTGFTNYEMAEFMLSLGCVQAVNGDGGGSSAFLSQRPGEELELHCSPSDGSERPTTHGILVISSAPSDGTFVRAQVSAPDDYYTPGSSVQFTAVGADLAGGAADIPAEAIWQLSDASLGTIENGLFVSNGTVGDVTAQLVYNGEVVGEDTIHVVVPESLAFVQSNITAPYSKSVSLDIVAKYGYNEVVLKDGDIVYALSDEAMGTLEGKIFTATSDTSIEVGTVTATLVHDEDISAYASITFGKASEIVYDFESGADSVANITLGYKDANVIPENYNFNDTFEVVSAEEGGKVKNGQYALKITSVANSITMMGWCQTRFNGWNIDLTDAVSLSFWMYIPEGSHGIEWDFGNAIPVNLGHEFMYGTGWQYLTVNVADIGTNVTKLDRFTLYHSDTSCTATNYDHAKHPNYYSDVVIYIDDITVNYSTAVEDFDPPVISDVLLSHDGTDTGLAMNGQQIDASVVNITAKAADSMEKTNSTGLDASSLKMYVDGNRVDASCNASGIITSSSIALANGMHTFRIEISDNRGNTTYVEKQIEIAASGNTKNTVKLAPKDATLKNLLADSVYWLDLTATAIEKVEKLELVIDLDNNSDWELDHMVLAEGFAAAYAIDAETNTVTLTISKTGDVNASGETVLASMPVRVWAPNFTVESGDYKAYRLVAVEARIEKGLLTETDGNQEYVGSEKLSTITEFNGTRMNNGDMYGYHSHTPEAVEDAAGSCTTDGYTGRTYCAVCDSIVDWGTTETAAGHGWKVIDDVMQCETCHELFNGTMDDKIYVDGVVADGWVNDTYYYVDGVMLVGSHLIDGVMCTFDENGVYQPDYKFEGFYEADGGTMYFLNNTHITGLNKINGVFYNFDKNGYAFDGEVELCGTVCLFDKGVSVATETVRLAGLCGEDAEYVIYTNGKMVVGGSGETMDCITIGNIPWYEKEIRNSITSLTIGKDITVIGTRLFYYIAHIDTINFEEGSKLEKIKGVAFGMCINLKDVYLPDGLTQIYGEAFRDCTDLTNVYVPQSVKGINATAFQNSTNVVLHVFEDSAAHKFAVNNNLAFVLEEVEVPEVKNGIVLDEDGEIRYYVDGVATYAGLVQDEEGNYYYINSSKKALKDCYYGISKTNGLLPAGGYHFAADGKMIVEKDEVKNGVVLDADGEIRYYVDGVATYAGLVQDDEGNYYYINSSKKALKNCYYGISKTNGLLPAGGYHFAADGKMIVEKDEVKNGIVLDADGEIRYYVDGVATYAGLVQDDEGNYYYINSSKKALKNCYYGISKTNGLLPAGGYYFAEDGKMIVK